MIPFASEPLPAKELRKDHGDAVARLIAAGQMAPDPEVANARLSGSQGPVTLDGANSQQLAHVRDVIARHCVTKLVGASLMLTAPHTHWQPGLILETWDAAQERYYVGPDRPFEQAWPMSFVFTDEGAVPYEWSAAVDPFDFRIMPAVYEQIDVLSEALRSDFGFWPLQVGVSINHRFKPVDVPPLVSTLEIPEPDTGLAYVVIDSAVARQDLTAGTTGQVGWSPFTRPVVSATAAAKFSGILEVLQNLELEEAQRFLRQLMASV